MMYMIESSNAIIYKIKNMVDITRRQIIIEALSTIKEDSIPVFGKMTAQHMVEHLTFTIKFSNGKFPQKLYYRPDKAEMAKLVLIYSNKEFPIGFKSPILGDDLPKLISPDISTSISKLFSELDCFDKFFLENEKPINPTLGPLDKQEWIKFHNKHFTHHFKQFKLI